MTGGLDYHGENITEEYIQVGGMVGQMQMIDMWNTTDSEEWVNHYISGHDAGPILGQARGDFWVPHSDKARPVVPGYTWQIIRIASDAAHQVQAWDWPDWTGLIVRPMGTPQRRRICIVLPHDFLNRFIQVSWIGSGPQTANTGSMDELHPKLATAS